MRIWIAVGILLCVSAGCHSSTAPSPVTIWNYQASELTSANGQVTCTFGAAMTLSDTTGPFTGTYQNAYLACGGPNGASSTLVTGTVNGGSISGSTVTFQFANTDVTNSGEVSATTQAFSNAGTLTNNAVLMTGTATVRLTLAGQTYVLTGPWQANVE